VNVLFQYETSSVIIWKTSGNGNVQPKYEGETKGRGSKKCPNCQKFMMWGCHIIRMRGLIALEQLMGMVLVAISVQMLLEGISTYFKALS